jgi:hypothetical protein
MSKNYGLTGVAPSIEVGKGAARLKSSGAGLAVRNNPDAADAPVTASTFNGVPLTTVGLVSDSLRANGTYQPEPTSLPPSGAASGQLGGTYPGPDVRGLRETSGPTLLTLGAVADGQVLVRSGVTVVGAALPSASPSPPETWPMAVTKIYAGIYFGGTGRGYASLVFVRQAVTVNSLVTEVMQAGSAGNVTMAIYDFAGALVGSVSAAGAGSVLGLKTLALGVPAVLSAGQRYWFAVHSLSNGAFFRQLTSRVGSTPGTNIELDNLATLPADISGKIGNSRSVSFWVSSL